MSRRATRRASASCSHCARGEQSEQRAAARRAAAGRAALCVFTAWLLTAVVKAAADAAAAADADADAATDADAAASLGLDSRGDHKPFKGHNNGAIYRTLVTSRGL